MLCLRVGDPEAAPLDRLGDEVAAFDVARLPRSRLTIRGRGLVMRVVALALVAAVDMAGCSKPQVMRYLHAGHTASVQAGLVLS